MRRPSRCVLLFARAPRVEARSKRLPGAERLFALAAERVAAAAEESGFDLIVVGEATPAQVACVGRLTQRGRGFTERLQNAFAEARTLGYEHVVIVPGDVPGLGAAHLALAARAMERGEVVLGPSPDGGVYLLGLPVATFPFDRVRWRTAEVFADLRHLARPAVSVLPPLLDVDRARDLRRLLGVPRLDSHLRRLLHELTRRAVPPATAEDVRPRSRFRPAAVALRGPPALVCPPALAPS